MTGTTGRVHPRLELELEVTFESEHNFYTGLTANISEGGLFVATHVVLPIGSKMELRFKLPATPRPIEVVGEVRWLRDSTAGEAAPGMGLRFVDISPSDLAYVQRFVETRETLFFEE